MVVVAAGCDSEDGDSADDASVQRDADITDPDPDAAAPVDAETSDPDAEAPPMDASTSDAEMPGDAADQPDADEPDAAADASNDDDAGDAAIEDDAASDAGVDAGTETDAAELDCPGATSVMTLGGSCQLPPSQRLAFVTSERRQGNFGGLAQADALCNSLAQDANLAGTFHAWLSSSTYTAVSRVSHGPYVRIDGVTFASSLDVLVSTGPVTTLHLTELNADYDGMVWTGTDPDGIHGGERCGSASWTSALASEIGMAGESHWTEVGLWTQAAEPYCNSNLAFYCFQDDCPGVGHVDFETDELHCGECGVECSANQACVAGDCIPTP